MGANSRFGDFFKSKRTGLGKTLRAFCAENGFDPGNLSKLERGVMVPPQSTDKLEAYAEALGLKRGSEDWSTFFDLASAESGRIPDELMSDSEVVENLPVLFRTLRGQRVSPEKLLKLIEKIRSS